MGIGCRLCVYFDDRIGHSICKPRDRFLGVAVGRFVEKKCARVVELADTLDLGSSAVRCAGSSPVPGTTLLIKF